MRSESPWRGPVLTVLLAAALPVLAACGSASADPLPTNFDTGTEESGPKKGLWPVNAVLDTQAKVLRLRWGGGDEEAIPFTAIATLERARPYEGLPDELLARTSEGRRVLLSSGTEVATHATLAPAMTGLAFVELPSGEGHLVTPATVTRAGPAFTVGSGAGFSVRASEVGGLLEGGTIKREERKLLTPVAEKLLASEGGGDLKKEEIELGLMQGLEKVRACYERQLARDPSLRGKVVTSFVIDLDGTVKHAFLKSSSLDNVPAETCIEDVVKTMKFIKPRGGGTVVVSYPFFFNPS